MTEFAARSVRDLAPLADGERGAVLAPDEDIAWLCAPRWESPAVFAGLLGGRRSGAAADPDALTLSRRIDATDGDVTVELLLDVQGAYGRRRSRGVMGR